ncbi:MAG: FAD binding domain-containing protein [Chloroflexota bacterium]
MITTVEQAAKSNGEFLAGGTDYMDRLRHHLASGNSVDLNYIAGLNRIEIEGGKTYIGAMTTMFNVAQAPHLRENYAGLAEAAGGLATPQIRQIGTIGGNLTQATRCQYYRHHHLECQKKGDTNCGGRVGYHPFGVVFDNGGCVAPHPSTLGMALYAYDAEVEINDSEVRPITALYGDGSDYDRDHLLGKNEIITKIILPATEKGEKAAYFRSIARARAEWALVECTVRLQLDGGTINQAFVAVGGVAAVPMRLSKVEAALVGQPATEDSFAEASELAADGVNPLPQTGYKVPLLVNTVEETLLRAMGLV